MLLHLILVLLCETQLFVVIIWIELIETALCISYETDLFFPLFLLVTTICSVRSFEVKAGYTILSVVRLHHVQGLMLHCRQLRKIIVPIVLRDVNSYGESQPILKSRFEIIKGRRGQTHILLSIFIFISEGFR